MVALFMERVYIRKGWGCAWWSIYGTTFVTGVFHTCYLYLKKEEWNKTEKTMLLLQNAILLLDSEQNT